MPNEFHQDVPAKVLADVQQHLNAIKAALAPYLLFNRQHKKSLTTTARLFVD